MNRSGYMNVRTTLRQQRRSTGKVISLKQLQFQ